MNYKPTLESLGRCIKCWGQVIMKDTLDGKELFCINCSSNQQPPKQDPDIIEGKPKKMREAPAHYLMG